MRVLVFGMLFFLLGCHPADIGLSGNAYSNLKYTLQNGVSELVYNNQNVSQVQLAFKTSDTLTEDISVGLTLESEAFTSDQLFTNFNQKLTAEKGQKTFKWILNINPALNSNQKLTFKIKVKDFSDKIEFTPDTFTFDFNLNFSAPVITSPVLNSYINNQNYKNFLISGSCENNYEVTIKSKTLSEIYASAACVNNSFSTSLDLSPLDDGVVTLQTSQSNQFGNTSPITEISYIKDTIIKNITLASDSHPLKDSTSHLSSLTISGTALITLAGENESLYTIYLYKDSACENSLASSSVSNTHFSFSPTLTGIAEGPISFYARLKNGAGSLLACTNINFNYFYSPRNLILGGNFDTINSNSFKNIAELNSDGSLIPISTFAIGSGYSHSSLDDYVRTILPLGGNRFFIGGLFDDYNISSASNSNLIDSNGSLIASTLPAFNNAVKTAAKDSAGNIYIGGNFDFLYASLTGANLLRRGLVKLGANLTLDNTFTQNLLSQNIIQSSDYVRSLVITDSGIIVGGRFPSLITKLTADGNEDSTFRTNMGTGFVGAAIYDIKQLPTGDLIIGGEFNTYNGVSCPNLAKISSSGVLDTTFCANIANLNLDSYVLTIERTTENILYLGGAFSKKIMAISTSGILKSDTDFGTGFDGSVYVIKEFVDGKLLIGGEFSNYNGSNLPGLIKINKIGSIDSTFKGNGKLPSGQSVYTIQF